jgi:hypothetical protein
VVDNLDVDQLKRVNGGFEVEPWRTWPSTSSPGCYAAISEKAPAGTVPGTLAGLAAGLSATGYAAKKLVHKGMSRGAALTVLGSLIPGTIPGTAWAGGMGAEYLIGSYVKSHDPACL